MTTVVDFVKRIQRGPAPWRVKLEASDGAHVATRDFSLATLADLITFIKDGMKAGHAIVPMPSKAPKLDAAAWTAKLNAKHAVIANVGGKCRILCENSDGTVTYQGFADFENRYEHETVEIATGDGSTNKFVEVGRWWRKRGDRRQFECVGFAPKGAPDDTYNLWRGFAFKPSPAGSCQLYLDHLLDNICSGDRKHYEYLISWMARAVQEPDTQGEVAVVLRGEMGTGKGVATNAFGKLFGHHFLHISNSSHLTGNFNAHLQHTVVLFADEAFYAGDKKHASVLKMLITEDTLTIEPKGYDTFACVNHLHLIMASNADWAVPAGPFERRFFVLDVSDAKMKDTKYFSAIKEQLANGGNAALLFMLQNHDLTGFNVREVPPTTGLQHQQTESMADEVLAVEEILENQQLPCHFAGAPNCVVVSELYEHLYKRNQRLRQVRPIKLRKAFLQAGATDRKDKTGNHQAFAFIMPDRARAMWEKWHGKRPWRSAAQPVWRDRSASRRGGDDAAPF
jgi:uncharacterized protein DUF5906